MCFLETFLPSIPFLHVLFLCYYSASAFFSHLVYAETHAVHHINQAHLGSSGPLLSKNPGAIFPLISAVYIENRVLLRSMKKYRKSWLNARENPTQLKSEDLYSKLHTSFPWHTARQQLLCVQILMGNSLQILPPSTSVIHRRGTCLHTREGEKS